MKFTNILLFLAVLIIVVYLVKPSLFYRALDAIGLRFVSEMRQVSSPVTTNKKRENQQLKGLDQP